MRRTLLASWGRSARARKGESLFLAFAVALIWTMHPLQTESVTYVIQRAESLMGLFYLLTVYCFIRFAGSSCVPRSGTSEDEQAGRSVWGWLSIGACLLGMATKEVMVTAPVIVLLYDRTFIAGSFGEAWRRRRGVLPRIGPDLDPVDLPRHGNRRPRRHSGDERRCLHHELLADAVSRDDALPRPGDLAGASCLRLWHPAGGVRALGIARHCLCRSAGGGNGVASPPPAGAGGERERPSATPRSSSSRFWRRRFWCRCSANSWPSTACILRWRRFWR